MDREDRLMKKAIGRKCKDYFVAIKAKCDQCIDECLFDSSVKGQDCEDRDCQLYPYTRINLSKEEACAA